MLRVVVNLIAVNGRHFWLGALPRAGLLPFKEKMPSQNGLLLWLRPSAPAVVEAGGVVLL